MKSYFFDIEYIIFIDTLKGIKPLVNSGFETIGVSATDYLKARHLALEKLKSKLMSKNETFSKAIIEGRAFFKVELSI
ncbi:MAG: hypothetical protein NC087_01620 [Anaeroplasma bactoclasticum]|nr:hypothetical protein [Anaeroplasma bactoclasticum]